MFAFENILEIVHLSGYTITIFPGKIGEVGIGFKKYFEPPIDRTIQQHTFVPMENIGELNKYLNDLWQAADLKERIVMGTVLKTGAFQKPEEAEDDN